MAGCPPPQCPSTPHALRCRIAYSGPQLSVRKHGSMLATFPSAGTVGLAGMCAKARKQGLQLAAGGPSMTAALAWGTQLLALRLAIKFFWRTYTYTNGAHIKHKVYRLGLGDTVAGFASCNPVLPHTSEQKGYMLKILRLGLGYAAGGAQTPAISKSVHRVEVLVCRDVCTGCMWRMLGRYNNTDTAWLGQSEASFERVLMASTKMKSCRAVRNRVACNFATV
eukprot:1152540-Pelagomonas_calceolata.AAC.1